MTTQLAESEEFYNLKVLARQLYLCSTGQKIHVECVLRINEISEDFTELIVLLGKCFNLNGLDKKPESALTSCLILLVNTCLSSSLALLDKDDRFGDLCLWLGILKGLNDSATSYPDFWTGVSSPKEGQAQLKSILEKRGENDVIYKKLMNVGELKEFLKPATETELYLERIDNVIGQFYDAKCGRHAELVEGLQSCIPADFKFSSAIFEQILNVEASLLNCAQNTQMLEEFYKMLFFVFEHAADQAQVCQSYADRNLYSSDHQSLRTKATENLFLASIPKLIGEKTPERTQLFHWLYVINPKSPWLVNSSVFEPLPVLPSEKVEVKEQPKSEPIGNELENVESTSESERISKSGSSDTESESSKSDVSGTETESTESGSNHFSGEFVQASDSDEELLVLKRA